LPQHYCAIDAQHSNREAIMSVRTLLLLIFAAPALLLGGAKALGMAFPVPEWGREYVLRFSFVQEVPDLELPEIQGPRDTMRPLVVIDAGHGGRDPGKVQRRPGGTEVYEKDIVLALSLELRDALLENGGIRVAMTREDDRIIPLAYRPEIARLLEADLFVSIHIDSAGDRSEVSGATVYTLSNEASSEAAARFAERENAADSLNGITVETNNSEVSDILVELSQERTQEDALKMADLILREGRGQINFHPFAKRSAELAVLRAPDVPGVLFESGFVTNDDDLEKLMSQEGRGDYVDVLERAIRVYLARRAET
jgi:N-acetylmuramoyl-L-alanine amidase